MWYSEIM